RSHARGFFAHTVSRIAGAGFAGDIQHERFDARVSRVDVFDAAAEVELGRDRQAALAALHENLQTVHVELSDQRSLTGDDALEVRRGSLSLRRLRLRNG